MGRGRGGGGIVWRIEVLIAGGCLTSTQASLTEEYRKKRDIDEQRHEHKASCPQNYLRLDHLNSILCF